MYNSYSCQNHSCHEYKRSVYLNYYYNCKEGLIDSRESKCCPNGRYICPNCLGCSNNIVIQKSVDRYIQDKRPTPTRLADIINQGHQDRGMYFCPKCGLLLSLSPEDERTYICPQCHGKYQLPSWRK